MKNGQPEVEITMTEDLSTPGRVACLMMGVSIERRRRILELRAQRDRLRHELALVEESLATEEADLAQEHTTTEELLDQWKRVIDGKFTEARAAMETAT